MTRSTVNLPTFLGIGGARCGTTWLYELLAAHPGVFVTETKELHYWSDTVRTKDFSWYAEQFGGAAGMPVRGEITPAYSSLSREVVASISGVLPQLRIVLLIRNPVDRIWSHAMRYYYRAPEKPRVVHPVRKYVRRFERLSTVRLTDYRRTIENWSAVYGRDAVFVGLYDDLTRDPEGLLRAVLRHIGADDAWVPPPDLLASTVNAKPDVGIEMPGYCGWYLSRRWLQPMQRLNEALGGRISHWVAELAGTRPESAWWPLRRAFDATTIAIPEYVAGRVESGLRSRAIVSRCEELAQQFALRTTAIE